MASLQEKADSIRSAVKSTTTCTPTIAALLNDLLLLKPNTSAPVSSANTTVGSNSKSTASKSRAKTPSRAGTRGAKTPVQETEVEKEQQLSPKEKYILATEVINATLKALGEAIKTPSTQRPAPAKDALKKSARGSLRRSTSFPNTPLQPRSLARVASSPNIGSRAGRSSSSVSISISGHRAAAECARISFACLRALQAAKASCIDLPSWQLESGMSALIGKLITLGLDDLATKELRILKRRLDAGQDAPEAPAAKAKSQVKASGTVAAAPIKSLGELLSFEGKDFSGPLLNLIITTQQQILKLMVSKRKGASIEAALPILQPICAGSPLNMLLQLSKDSKQTAKAGRQLEQLSQLILSLCPNISTSEDIVALEPRLNPAPEVAFQLQVLALKIRKIWWKLCSHQGNIEKQLLEPFSKCLTAFVRRTPTQDINVLEIATNSFDELIPKQRTTGSRPMAMIFKVLGSLAQEAGLITEALEWTQKLKDSLNSQTITEVTSCSTAARLLTLKLRQSPVPKDAQSLLVEILEVLSGPLKCDTNELDELLVDISSTRRTTIALLARKSAPAANVIVALDDEIKDMCESLIVACPKFCARYLGRSPEGNEGAKALLRFEQRRKFVTKPAYGAIDSALFHVKSHLTDNRLSWDTLDSTLIDCLTLLDRLEGQEHKNDKSPGPTTSYYTRISNLYYSLHLNMRRDSENPKDNQYIRPLRRSIDCVSSRPTSEKAAAMLNTKLERLADIYRSHNASTQALETLMDLRKELVAGGVLADISVGVSSRPLQTVLDSNARFLVLSRTLTAIVKLGLKTSQKSAVTLFDVGWSTEEKGIVLEIYLAALASTTKKNSTPALHQSIDHILRELDEVYQASSFPVRRLRVLARVLQLEPEYQNLDSVKKWLSSIELPGLAVEGTMDIGLQSYLPHLKALCISLQVLQEPDPSLEQLKSQLGIWSSMLDKCESWISLQLQVDDEHVLLNTLQTVADFFDMKGYSTYQIAVLRLITKLGEVLENALGPDNPVISYTSLGSQYLGLGYSGKAGLALDKAQGYASRNGVSKYALVQLQLAYGEYYLAIDNPDRCEEALNRALSLVQQSSADASSFMEPATLADRNKKYSAIAQASFLHSLLSLERGSPQVALMHAKRSVRLMYRIWAHIGHQNEKTVAAPDITIQTELDQTTSDMSNMSMSVNAGKVQESEILSNGPSFWPFVKQLFRSLSQLSILYSHHGMFQETIYYAEQAQKIATEANAVPYIMEALTFSGGAWLRAGTLEKASEILMQAKDLQPANSSYQQAKMHSYMALMYRQDDDFHAELGAYAESEKTLNSLMCPQYINSLDKIRDELVAIEEELSKLKLTKTKSVRKAPIVKKTVARSKTPVERKTTSRSKTPVPTTTTISEECSLLESVKSTVLQQKAQALLLQKRINEASLVLREAEASTKSRMDEVRQHISFATQLLHQGISRMMADPVYSVLQESTISFPSVTGAIKSEKSTPDRSLSTAKSPRKTPARGKAKAHTEGFFDMLKQAQEHLLDAQSIALYKASTSVVHTISSLMSSVVILLSAAGSSMGKATAHPGYASCSIETARNLALRRERKAIMSDRTAPASKSDDLQWPTLPGPSDHRRSSIHGISDVLRFQRDYVDIIPQTWTAISIALSEDRQELCLTRLQAGHSPFVLRLPLGRNNSRDADEEIFDYAQGHAELLEIIDLANASSHEARNVTGKSAKTAWWEERNSLDARLKDLLENIEKVWLGGFKGIFSQQTRQPDLLARFQKSFNNILQKHLPSRQKSGRKTKTSHKVTLDTRILELFIGLGDASAEDCDLDEPLTDLLYFVVDILQFNGERNAYDEIDFDSLVVETHDALRCYHEAVHSAGIDDCDSHTILILDKALHAFPWESLPCMNGLAVSRLPSLGCLRERILMQQELEPSEPAGHYISRSSGAFVLNPGNDLTSTQTTFEKELRGLPSWHATVNTEPTESSIKTNLESKDLFLYFGHGSGAQYIRSRTIKRLDKCAVTMLMGCSSGALTEAGEFEPYGPPISYMHAGAPALVATLWDVTDKDIDRFAKSTFEEWGLFDVKSCKGKERARTEERKISLVEAVARGKGACNLKYLTAAAVVVYGVPVYFK